MANGGGKWQHSILAQSLTLRDMVLNQGSDRFIEMNDGELAYSTRMQALSGQGLVLDPAASNALLPWPVFRYRCGPWLHPDDGQRPL